MNLIKKASISFLTLAIVACGGGGSPTEKAASAKKEEETITGAVTVGTPNIGRGSASTFVSSELELDLTSIASGGTTNIKASVVDTTKSNALIDSKPYAVIFSSSCEGNTPSKAEFSAKSVITNSGNVATSYTAKGCVGVDQITATLYNAAGTPAIADTSKPLAKANVQVTVETATFGSITFVSNSNDTLGFAGIGKSGAGAFQSSSLVTFKVTDNFGNPLEGQEVSFAISSQLNGNASATAANISAIKATTNAEGIATTTLNAGTNHEIISVIASTLIVPDNTKPTETITKETSSLPISITTGLPVQTSFSLSAATYNVNAFSVDATVLITARLGDRFGNPVPNTIVNFTAESGTIDSRCITAPNGACTVDWNSGGERPGQFTNINGLTKNNEYLPVAPITNPVTFSMQAVMGYTTITAYAVGEAGYNEQNSNGVFDIGESFDIYPEVFRNDNGNFDASGKTIRDGGANGEPFFEHVIDGSYSSEPSVYQGPLCSIEAQAAGHCSSNMHVRRTIRLVQVEGDDPYVVSFYKKVGTVFTLLTGADTFDVSADGLVYLLAADRNGNMPANNLSFAFKADGYKSIDPIVVNRSEPQFLEEEGFPVSRGLLHSFQILPDIGAAPTQLEVTLPNGFGKAYLNITP